MTDDFKQSSQSVNYIDLLRKNFKYILISALSCAAISSIVVFLIVDPIFLSTAVVKTSLKSGGLGGLLSSSVPDLGDLGEIAGVGGSSASRELALYENILMSRKCIDEVLIKFKLNDDWEYKYFEDAVKNFRENILTIKKDKAAGILEVGIFDKNPVRAKEIADFMISQLNKINTDLNVLNARNNREFIETRYNLVKEDLQKSEDSLKSYQDKFGLAPDIVIKATSQVEIQLEIELKSEEIKLDLLRKILSPDQAEVKAQENKIAAMKQQLSEMQNSTDNNTTLKLKGAPDIVMNYLRLQRNVEIQNKILTFVIPLFEQAKVEEKKEMPSVLVLDAPIVPEKKSKPKRLTIILIYTVLGAFLTFIYFFSKEKWKLYKSASTVF
jgi:capsule polysaccharide export protein KpsE/RkpR